MKNRALKRKNEEEEEVDSEGTWAVSYGDMVTLLLTFFIIFFSTDPKQGTKQRMELKVSLIETFKSRSSIKTDSGITQNLNIGRRSEDGIDKNILKKLNGVAHDKGNHILIEFPYISFFKSGKIDLTKEGAMALENFVNLYMPYAGNYHVGIRAFSDKRAVKNEKNRKFSDNLELSALRSVATMRVLQKSGIPLNRLKLGGFGELIVTARELEEIPLDKRSPSSEYDLARKVVLVIEPETI